MIAKNIHYCWFGPHSYSRAIRRCQRTWQTHLRDYTFFLWNEQTCAQYAAEHHLANPMNHPFVRSAMRAQKYAFVADYVRFWALYHVGGVFLDTDMYVLRPFDDLLDHTFFSAYERPLSYSQEKGLPPYISCGVIGCVQHNDCVQQILLHYDTLLFDEHRIANLVVPKILTTFALHHPEAHIYPYDYFYPFPYEDRYRLRFLSYRTPNTYAIHLWDLSWSTWYRKLYSYFLLFLQSLKRRLTSH